jgi:DNA (cytosine-5)-methyltransferase 1
MKYIELFAGIGGFRYGLDVCGHECVFSNEWVDKARYIYNYNYGELPDGRDVRTIHGSELPEADLIVGGFPCATFSLAGKRTGFCLSDARGSLCFEMFRIARERRVPYLLFENVKGLLNHDSGKTFAVIISALDELGYDCQWELLDTQNFGIPQHRERVFLIGNLRGHPRPKVFPIGITNKENGGEASGESKKREGVFSNVSPTLDANYHKGGASRPYVVTQWRRNTFRDYKSEGTPTLTANMGTGGNNTPFIRYPDGIRKLTPTECERLQGLPDGYTKFLKDEGGRVSENSDSDRYERCGRTVSSTVIKAIGTKLGRDWYE